MMAAVAVEVVALRGGVVARVASQHHCVQHDEVHRQPAAPGLHKLVEERLETRRASIGE